MLEEEFIVKGPKRIRVIPEECTIGEFTIDSIRKRNPNDIFCVDGSTDKSLTCKEVLDEILKTTVILRNFGVESGDVVAIISENHLSYSSIINAIYYVGATANLLNPTYTVGEIKGVLKITKPKVAFISPSVAKNLRKLEEEGIFINHVILLGDISYQDDKCNHNTIHTFEKMLNSVTLNEHLIEPAKIDPKVQNCLILQSSGSTGLPKSVLITHNNTKLSTETFLNPEHIALHSKDVVLSVVPSFHVFGCAATFVVSSCPIKLITLPSFKPDIYLKCIEKYKVTVLFAVPTLICFLAEHPLVKNYDLSSLNCVISAGSALNTETLQKFSERLPNAQILQTYGCTEYSGFITTSSRNMPTYDKHVGKMVPGTEGIIWNSELNRNVGLLETGEICIRGPSFMKGYLNVDDNGVDEFGFYHTGDLGYYDEFGHVYVVGRIKEIIKYKGFQVAPIELENILMKHKSIEDCAVFGIPDDRSGQLPGAFVTLKRGEDVTEEEIIKFVSERISVHKRLHGGVRFISAIPRNSHGKILRNQLLPIYQKQ